MNNEFIEAPTGYYFGDRYGQVRRHLVKIDLFNIDALCGVQVARESFMEIANHKSKFCPKCVKKLKEQGVEWQP